MGLFYEGASSRNDDLFAPQLAKPKNKDGTDYDPSQWGGVVEGGEKAATRYEGMGAAAAGRAAHGMDYSQSRQAEYEQRQGRDFQNEAMRLAQQTAFGQSLASEQQGRAALRQGLDAQQAGAMSARGGAMAQMAALRGQQSGASQYMQSGTGRIGAMRAQEMAQGRQRYMDAATGLRGQDMGYQSMMEERARQQQRAEMAQRQLNDQSEFGYDQMADDTRKAQATAGLRQQAAMTKEEQVRQMDIAAGKAADMQTASDQVQVGASIASMASDVRLKDNVRSLDNMSQALSSGLAPYSYTYKPDTAGAEGQSASEQNVGPMAQSMASNPITATAVTQRPDGKLAIDLGKSTKLALGGIGHLAAKQQALESEIATLKRGKNGTR